MSIKKILLCTFCLSPFLYANAAPYNLQNILLLPNPFPVFTDGKTVVNHPYLNYTKKLLPIDNSYSELKFKRSFEKHYQLLELKI